MAGTVTTETSALARTKKTSRISTTSTGSIRVSELISALSYALDLTEGRPMGHSVRACVIGMRIAEEIGLPPHVRADVYCTLLLKDAGCSSNSSRLYHILNADDIRAKGDLKTTDWTRVGWESLHYALTHVATGDAFPQRVWRLVRVAATQQRDSCELVKIRCERGSSIVRKLGFSEAVAAGIYSLDELEWWRVSKRAAQTGDPALCLHRQFSANAGSVSDGPRQKRSHRSCQAAQRSVV
jgi:hypothetical protein